MGSLVPTVNEGTDLCIQILDRCKDSAAYGLALDDAEPHLGLLHERVTGRVTQPEWLAWS